MDEIEARRMLDPVVRRALFELEWAATLLRSSSVTPAPSMMRMEITLTKSIESLRALLGPSEG
jgi:hypothetical protein